VLYPLGVAPDCQNGVYGRMPWLLGVLLLFKVDEMGLRFSDAEFDGGVKRLPTLTEADVGNMLLRPAGGGNFCEATY
jgi:hypothetical protein